MIDAVLAAAVWTLIEAMSVVTALAVLDGAQGLSVRDGQMGKVLQVFRRKGAHDIAEGGHEESPCMRELIR